MSIMQKLKGMLGIKYSCCSTKEGEKKSDCCKSSAAGSEKAEKCCESGESKAESCGCGCEVSKDEE